MSLRTYLAGWSPWVLRAAIRDHRSQKADDRCIEDDDRLYAILGDGIVCDRRVGNKEEMLRNCVRFIERRCEAGGWPTYAELEAEIVRLKKALWLDSSSAWPLRNVLTWLADWCVHLHEVHECDCHGYESRSFAIASARLYVFHLAIRKAEKRCDVCRKEIADGGFFLADGVITDLCSTECFSIYAKRELANDLLT